ncbi:MAG: hypothetical protein WBZ05_07195, partial [Desulfobacterales bacterium]
FQDKPEKVATKAPQYDLPDLPRYHLPELRGRRGRQKTQRIFVIIFSWCLGDLVVKRKRLARIAHN